VTEILEKKAKMGDKTLIVMLVAVLSLAMVHGIGLGDLTKVYNLLKNGLNATCVTIPEMVTQKIVPLRCVKCENDLWSFNGTISFSSLKKCVNSGDQVGANTFTLMASVALSIITSFYWA